MTTTTLSGSLATQRVLDRINLEAVGGAVIRYGRAGVIGWIGLMKFTPVEAEAIRPLAAHSPLMNWASAALGVRPFSNLVGAADSHPMADGGVISKPLSLATPAM